MNQSQNQNGSIQNELGSAESFGFLLSPLLGISTIPSFMPYFVAVLCGLSILLGQYLYGGLFRSAFAFPSYLILVAAALISAVYLILRKQDVPRVSCVGLMGAVVLWIVLRSYFGEGLPQASESQQLALGCFSIYLMLAFVVVKAEARIVFLLIVLGGALIQAGVAGGQFFGVWGGQPQGWMSEQLRVWYDKGDIPSIYRRAHGFYINGNHLVWLLNAAGFFALAMGAFGRGKAVAKVLWIYVGGTCLAISLACLSRGGLLALGGGMIFIFILSAVAISRAASDRRVAAFSVLIGAFAIPTAVMLLILNQNASIQARASLLFEEGYRPQVWMTALREFQMFPWLGAGPGAFTYFSRQFRLGASSTDDYFAHNDWLQLAADYGFPLLALAIVVVVVHLTCGCRGYIRILRGREVNLIPQSNSAALLIGAATVVAAFSIHSLFDFNLQLPANALLAAACLGMLANDGQGGRNSSDAERWRSILRRIGPALLIGVAMGLLASIWFNRTEFQRLEAENYMLMGEYNLALQIAEEAALNDEKSPTLNYIMGVSRQRLAQVQNDPKISAEQLELAIGDLQKNIRFAPRDRSASIELARSLLMAGRLEDAKKVAFEVIQLEPRQTTGYELYGSILEAQGNIYSARRVYLLGATLSNTEFLRHRLEVLGKNVESLP